MNKKLFLTSLSLAALVLAGCGEKPVDPGKPYDPNTPADPVDPDTPADPTVYGTAEELANAAFACFPEDSRLTNVALDSDDGSYWFAAGYDAADGVTTALAGYTKGAEAIKDLGLTYGTPETEDGEYYVEFTYSEKIGGSIYVYEYEQEPGLFVFQFAAAEEGAEPEENWYDLYVLFGYEYVEGGMDKDLINNSLGTTGIEFPVVNSEAVYGIYADEETEETYGITYIVKVQEDVSKAYATQIQPLLAVLNAEEDEDVVYYSGYDAEHSFVVQFSCGESFLGDWLEFQVKFIVFDEVYTDKLTEDTQWNETTAAYLESIGVTLPFVQMGDNYQFTAEYLEDYGCYSIYDTYYLDLTANWTFDGYTLDEDATSETYGYLVKVTEDGYTYILDAYWNNGNWIDIYIVEPVVYATATLVTDISQLTDGTKVIFGNAEGGAVAGESSGKFFYPSAATFEDGVVSYSAEDATVFTVVVNEDNTYSFVADGANLVCSGDKNLALSETTAAAKWTISIDGVGAATITSTEEATKGNIQYNYNTGSERFTNYKSKSLHAIELYLVTETTTSEEI